MMPQVFRLRICSKDSRGLRLWIPLLPVAIVLSPLLLLGMLVLAAMCLAQRINPVKALYRTLCLFAALRGLRIEVRDKQDLFLVDVH